MEIFKIITDNLIGVLLTILNLTAIALDQWTKFKTSKIAEKKAPLDNTNLALEISEDAATIVKSYTEEIRCIRVEYKSILTELRLANEKIAKTDKILVEWGEGIKKLLNQLKKLNEKPCWEPSLYWEEIPQKSTKKESW